MNRKTFRLVFNKHLGALVPVAEFVSAQQKSPARGECSGQASAPVGRAARRSALAARAGPCRLSECSAILRGHSWRHGLRAGFLGLALGAPVLAQTQALPEGGEVVRGEASMSRSGQQMTIHQRSDKVGINWQSYRIGEGNSVTYRQPSSSSVALNRVIGTDRSEIYGNLNANGKVFLINPNGILFARSAQVNVGGLLASTRDISDQDFMDGRYRFAGDSSEQIVNQGHLRSEGGSIVLSGQQVVNEGTIETVGGRTTLAAGQAYTVQLDAAGRMSVQVTRSTLNALVDHRGLIVADDGSVYLTAHGRQMAQTAAINVEGVVRARGIRRNGGTVILDGGTEETGGVVEVSAGEIDVSSNARRGGTVILSGQYVGVRNGGRIDASGDAGGGRVILGGDKLNKARDVFQTRFADKAVLDSTSSIDIHSGGGDGGFLETSGRAVAISGSVNGRSAGRAGQWLIDPDNLIISNSTGAGGGNSIYTPGTGGSYVQDSALKNADITLDANAGANAGDIYSDSDVNVNLSLIHI